MLTEIMANSTCPNCGATLIAGAKFCRQCGRLVVNPSAPSVTEATTRTLRTPAEFGSQPTDFFSTQHTSPAYISPREAATPPSYATSNLEQQASKRNVWLITLLATLFVLSLIALGIIAYTRNTNTTPQPPSVTAPEPPDVGAPEIPSPPGPPPAGRTGANSISRAFIYPGAETVMEMKTANSRDLLQLRTTDSFQKVVDWYTAKLKLQPNNVFKTSGSVAILKADDLTVIINSSEAGTVIMLQEGEEADLDFDP